MAEKKTLPAPQDSLEQSRAEEVGRRVAEAVLRPSLRAATSVNCFRPAALSPLALHDLVGALSTQAAAVTAGSLARMEEMLVAQAHTLDAIFNRLAGHAAMYVGEQPDMVETYLKLALRSQSQCRASIEALGALKNPPVVFAKQANFAQGHQQVNNGVGHGGPSPRTQETRIPQTELLEAEHGQRMDTRAPRAPGRADPALATVGAVNGTQKRRRKGAR